MQRRTFLGQIACAVAVAFASGLGCGPTKYTEIVRFKIGHVEAGHRLHGVLVKQCGLPSLKCPALLDDGSSGYLVAGFADIAVHGYSFDPSNPRCHEIFKIRRDGGKEVLVPLTEAWHRIEVVEGEEYVLVESDAEFVKARRQTILENDFRIITAEEAWGMSFRA